MYKVLLAVGSEELLKEITALHVWGDATGFELYSVEDEIEKIFSALRKEQYDLLIVEISANDEILFSTLKRIIAEGLCRRIALCSEIGDFHTAREGMLIGAYEYLVSPMESGDFIRLFSRIKNEENGSAASEIYFSEELAELFEKQSSGINEYIESIQGNEGFVKVIKSTVRKIFDTHEWLDLYLCEEDFLGDGENDSDLLKQDFLLLFEIYRELYPQHNEKIHSVINYVLYNPESDLRQKTLSEELYINSSYLSTMFTAQTDIRFVDYITSVKLHRAAWLLKNTKMKIVEIAERLDYKDIGYFSRQFKKLFGITPSGYRIPDNYEFQI